MKAENYVYYAIMDGKHTRDEPLGLVRREILPKGGKYDHGDTRYDFAQVDDAEAARLVEYFRSFHQATDQQS